MPGVAPAEVLVLGGGVAGAAAATVAAGMGARVTIVDRSIPRLIELDERFAGRVRTVHASELAIEELLPRRRPRHWRRAGPGRARAAAREARAPCLHAIGSVLVDISIDQGGCFETSRPTTHSDPVYEVTASCTTA